MPAMYPWEKWFERATKRRVSLNRGREFECLPHSMAQQLRNAAYRHRYKVSVDIHEDSISFEALEMGIEEGEN